MKQLTYAVVLGAWTITSVAFGGVEYNRKPLPDEENAWTYWEGSLEQFNTPNDTNLWEPFRAAYSFDMSLPTGNSARKLQQWIASKDKALEAISEGIAVGKLQFPKFKNDEYLEYLSELRNLARIKIAKARFFMRVGRYKDAARKALQTDRMGRMISQGEGGLFHYLVGVDVQKMGLNGIRHLGDVKDTPQEVLEGFLNNLPSRKTEDPALALMYRVDFSCSLIPRLKKFQKDAKASGKDFPVPIADVLNRRATIELAEDFYERFIANALSSWENRDTSIEEDASEMVSVNGLEDVDVNKFLFDVTFDTEDNESGQRWKKLDRVAEEYPNIFGKILIASIVPAHLKAFEKSVKVRTKANLTRAYIGIRLYEMKNGQLPNSLSDLVSSDVLSDLPRDLFSGNTVKYSQQQRKLWSVGPDSEDHEGDKEKDIVIELSKQEEDSDKE